MRFYKQETKYTCGPASMRMVLQEFGIKKTEVQLTRAMKCTKRWGTKHKSFPPIAEQYHLNYLVKRNGSIDNLREFRKRGYDIIVCYFHLKARTGHYAVIKKIEGDHIHLYDPDYGHDRKLSVTFFGRIWKCPGERGWFIAIKKPRGSRANK